MASRAAEWTLGEFFEYRGDRVAYDAVGEGPPIVLVHGTPFSSYVWRRIAPALAENYRVHVFDLLGYGPSDKREGQDVSLPARVQGGRPHVHARTVLSGIVYAFPEARPCHSRVAEELEGYGGEQLELRGGHFVPTGEGNDVIKNSGTSCSETQSPLSIIPPV